MLSRQVPPTPSDFSRIENVSIPAFFSWIPSPTPAKPAPMMTMRGRLLLPMGRAKWGSAVLSAVEGLLVQVTEYERLVGPFVSLRFCRAATKKNGAIGARLRPTCRSTGQSRIARSKQATIPPRAGMALSARGY